jgi:hypothetical protein
VSTSDAPEIELEVRVHPGGEKAAAAELEVLGVTGVEVTGVGTLRVPPGQKMRVVLAAERPLAVYAVRPMPGVTAKALTEYAALSAAIEVAAVAMNAPRGDHFGTYRLTIAPDIFLERGRRWRLSAMLGRRLRLDPAIASPDLVVILRTRADGLEFAARLPAPRRQSAAARPEQTRTSEHLGPRSENSEVPPESASD